MSCPSAIRMRPFLVRCLVAMKLSDRWFRRQFCQKRDGSKGVILLGGEAWSVGTHYLIGMAPSKMTAGSAGR